MPLKHLSVSEDEEWNREKGEKKICSGKRRKVDVSNPVNVLGDEQEEEHEDFRDVFNNVLIFSSFYRES